MSSPLFTFLEDMKTFEKGTGASHSGSSPHFHSLNITSQIEPMKRGGDPAAVTPYSLVSLERC